MKRLVGLSPTGELSVCCCFKTFRLFKIRYNSLQGLPVFYNGKLCSTTERKRCKNDFKKSIIIFYFSYNNYIVIMHIKIAN